MIINISGGTGVMGRVHKPVFEADGHQVILSGRKTIPNLEQAADMANLTIVSVPISATIERIKLVAPYCKGKAIADFTGLKEKQVEAMLKYTSNDCEVVGIHPMYGDVHSIEGRGIVWCDNERTGERCREVRETFKKAGAKIIDLNPTLHDKYMAYVQGLSKILLEAFGLSLKQMGRDMPFIYDLCPARVRPLINITARQLSKDMDITYREMMEYNPHQKQAESILRACIHKTITEPQEVREELRVFFGPDLKKHQELAKLII